MNSSRRIPRLTRITLLAPAKINLWLSILGREKGGYHSLVSMMQMVNLYDRITLQVFRKTSGTRLSLKGQKLQIRGNLVLKAVLLFRRAFGFRGGLHITLDKNIPVGAGLAGGSSDAAATLAGLAKLHADKISRRDLSRISRQLGSDVPFFFEGPSAWVRGRGLDVLRVGSPKPYWVVLVNPGFEVSTTWAYGMWDRKFPGFRAESGKIIKKIGLTSGRNVPRITSPGAGFPPYSRGGLRPRNDLERVTVDRYPVIARIKRRLRVLGAHESMMSGSGPTVFGLFKDQGMAQKAAGVLRGEVGRGGSPSKKLSHQKDRWKVWVVRTLRRSPF